MYIKTKWLVGRDAIIFGNAIKVNQKMTRFFSGTKQIFVCVAYAVVVVFLLFLTRLAGFTPTKQSDGPR